MAKHGIAKVKFVNGEIVLVDAETPEYEEKQPEYPEFKKFYVKDARLVRRQLPDDVVNHNGVHFSDTFELVLGPYGGITQDDVTELMRLIETETPVILVPVKRQK